MLHNGGFHAIASLMIALLRRHRAGCLLVLALLVTAAVYWPGLSGSWLFDDYPNIVDNPGVQPHALSVPALVRVVLSSPASEFKRPLASLSFAANYLVGGLHPWGWKLFNVLVHLLNGVLVFVLARKLLTVVGVASAATLVPKVVAAEAAPAGVEKRKVAAEAAPTGVEKREVAAEAAPTTMGKTAMEQRAGILAALIAAGWMLLPINLTAVLYVVQREESMANVFVLIGLIGYVTGRLRMLQIGADTPSDNTGWGSFWLCTASLVVLTAVGILAKETAVMLPLYALAIEWIVFRFRRAPVTAIASEVAQPVVAPFAGVGAHPVRDAALGGTPIAHRVRSYNGNRVPASPDNGKPIDWRIASLFVVVLLLPMAIGLTWLLPSVLQSSSWATRNFTLGTRLLSEARIVCDYVGWTLFPTPHALSFYHDEYRVSTGLLTPWTTLAGILGIAALIVTMVWLRKRRPLVALGIALFLACQLLTGTILSLELVYEHRNYFASFGVMLAVVPWLSGLWPAKLSIAGTWVWMRRGALVILLAWWAGLTAVTAYDWGEPLRLAQTLAARAPDSPRAEYELGRLYIAYSHYDPTSPYTHAAYAPLEKAASFPESSILPQQALIFMNSRMGLPLKAMWWDTMIAKLKARKPGVQDVSSLAALAQCAKDGACPLPTDRMQQAFAAALDHPAPSARLQATYGDYAWNVLSDHALGLQMIEGAVQADPGEPAYRITLARMDAAQGHYAKVEQQLTALRALNIGGRLDRDIASVEALLPAKPAR